MLQNICCTSKSKSSISFCISFIIEKYVNMFPQSELDNYKLQIELLQDKLQRSEISRQQLEHKLDKILQKRDEHEKVVRSKAREKYQQFLEEQQRRNERNKQLVQMLERIEQQTEVLNARSERLKMMKLQYEMYFAKLVHTQTRRCLQNSIQPMTHFMATCGPPGWPTVQPSTMEGHHYGPHTEATIPLETNNAYQYFATTTQEENMPLKTSDIPTLTQFVRKEERNVNMPPRMYENSTEILPNMADVPPNFSYYKNNQEIPDNFTSNNKTNADIPNPTVAYLLANDKTLSEPNHEHSNLTTTAASTKFEAAPNLAVMPQKVVHTLKEIPKSSRVLNSSNANFNKTLNQPLNSAPRVVTEMPLTSTNEKDKDVNDINKFSAIAQTTRIEIQSPTTIELKNNESNMPNQNQTSSTSMQPESANTVGEPFLLGSSKNKNYLKKQVASMEKTEEEFFENKAETNSSDAPVSIENIETKIYGELLLPLENEKDESEQTANVVPKLLQNLVTQSEEHIENITNAEAQAKQQAVTFKNNEEHATTTTATANDNEQSQNVYNYEQNATNDDLMNSVQQSEESAHSLANYSNYENVVGGENDESQQQYDYSNYDPTQYSYPGYVYDETTGEYKPDPNAPLEQYATDQQYAAEGYEQQYQQQNYDYNQTYAEEATGLVTTGDNLDNIEYATTQKDSSIITATDENVLQPPELTTSTATPPQTVAAPEEASTTSATPKVIKPTSILSSADKNESQKKKKRVNFIDSSETDESAAAPTAADKAAASTSKPADGNLVASSESDFDFSSSTEAEAKGT